jgi:hypothetical protein
MTMENFFAYITVPVPEDEAEVWFSVNNMTIEKRQLYADFCLSLLQLIQQTYLDNEFEKTAHKILLSKEEKDLHFEWCWKQTLNNFEKEGIKFKVEGEHREYLKEFFDEVFYDQKEEQITENVFDFLVGLFDEEKSFTKSDLNMITEIYKLFEKSYT